MKERKKTDFCTECRKETEYVLKKKEIFKTIKGKTYPFSITVAVCSECGQEMNLPGLIDKNVQEMDEQYRAAENLVTVEDIEKLMKVYKLGKAPLSLALGFGEITISRYLSGQIPSKEYSQVMRMALYSTAYMKKCLQQNKDKIADAAYKKSMEAVSQLESIFCVSQKMLRVISCLFESLEEVTPLMLQKLLYFVQGVHLALYDRELFTEDCEAWVHGPVYADVYTLLRDFKYNPIDDARFAILGGNADSLTADEKKVVDLVAGTFGLYGGKVLERITHKEKPWKEARKGYSDTIPSHELISKTSIREYYKRINEIYRIDSEEGLTEYIRQML
ncbi:MAG: DUF4065 domain-containing protein [Clostridiales bacterium]|nr:DUF4065 domain-containing protein [Clostridiales bacterium]